ncbi:MAG: 2,5-diamino-6-(ribosylamino)-4(3H)-pyrimidinone 5'-phosphate reductase [Candidatus Methanomethylophilaceae archaeon]
MSADGKIAGKDRTQISISSREDKDRVKRMRRDNDGILVGVGTVVSDDPHLTVKGLGYDENPVRIVLDPHGRTPEDALVLDDRAPTVIVTLETCEKTWKGATVMRTGKCTINLEDLVGRLYSEGIKKLMVEGGGETISHFFNAGLVDRYSVFVGSLIIGGRDAPTPVDGDGLSADNGIKLELINFEKLGDGVLLEFAVLR